jgi:DnaK suppressor protein
MNKKELGKIKEILLEKRKDLKQFVKDKKGLELVDSEIGDEVDTATQTAEKELLFELTDNETAILADVELALKRFEKGKFGKCDLCNKEISQGRINALPWVRYCIDCQARSEGVVNKRK